MKISILAAGAVAFLVAAQTAHAGITTYNVTQTFNQVVYDLSHPDWDTVFSGSFSFDDATGTVSGLTGKLSQAMDGAPVPGASNWVGLTHQLSAIAVDSDNNGSFDGLVVSVFKNNSTDTFLSTNGPFLGGTFGTNRKMGPVKTNGTQNAFASVYINLADPTAALNQAQLNYIGYGDCTPAALMPRNGSGATCMAGWNAYDAGGALIPGGTMKGALPNSQTITAAVPEPQTYAMLLAGIGLVGLIARRRNAG